MPASPLPSPRDRRRREGLERRRADAIAGASAIFAAKGFHDAQMSEIAAAAELSRNSLYAMFESKEQLFQEVVSTAARAIRDAVKQRAGEFADPGEQLLSIIDSLFACFQQNQDFLLIYARGTQGLPWKIREAMGESSQQNFESFTDWVVEVAMRAQRAGHLRGLDAEAVGVSLVGAVTTAATRWIERTPARPLSQAAGKVRAVFAHALGPAETT